MLDGDDEEALLRFTVGGMLRVLADDEDDFAAALAEMGCPLEEAEKETAAGEEWRREYLLGCDSRALYAWLVWFAIRDQEYYNPTIDEDRLWSAEILLGLREPGAKQPVSADEEDEDEEEGA